MTGSGRRKERKNAIVANDTGRNILSSDKGMNMKNWVLPKTTMMPGLRKYGEVIAVLIGCPKKNFSTSDDQSEVEKCMGGCLGEDKTGRIIISETTQ